MPLRRTPAVTLSRSAKRQPLLSFVNAVHRRAHACRVYVYADMLPRRQRRRVRHDSAVRAHARVTAHMHVGSSDVRALFMPLRRTPAAALPHSAKRQPLLPLVTPSTDARTNAAYMPPHQPVDISDTRALFMPLRQTPAATLPHSAKRQLLLPFVYAVHRRAHGHHVHIHAEALPRGQFRRVRHNSIIHAHACVAARKHVGSFDVRALFMPLRQSPAAALPHSAKRQPLLPLVNAIHRRAHAHHVHIHAEALPRGQRRRVRHNLAVRAHACVAARQYVGSFDVCTLFMPLQRTPAVTLSRSAKRQPLLPLVSTLHRRANARHVYIHAEALLRGQFRRVRHNSVIHAHACVAARKHVGSFDVRALFMPLR